MGFGFVKIVSQVGDAWILFNLVLISFLAALFVLQQTWAELHRRFRKSRREAQVVSIVRR
jgi:hypothetical protein